MNYSKKMNIENLITKKNRLDRRYKLIVELERWFNKYTLASAMWSLIITSTAWCYLSDRTSLQPLKQTIIPKVEEVKAIELKRFCDDPISYIRCRGEDLEKTNQEIMTMIRIAKAESTLNPNAKNKNSSASGLFQIIAGTWYSNDCVGDKWNYKDNTDCAWKIETLRGFQPWVSSSNKWNK
jgi:hypothetical protein